MTIPAGVVTPAPVAPVVQPTTVEDAIRASFDKLAASRGVSAEPVPLVTGGSPTGSTAPSPAPTDASASTDSTVPDGTDGLAESTPSDDGIAVPAVEGAPEGEPATGEAEVADQPIVVAIPAKRPGEAAFNLTVQNEEEAERVRQLVNGYMRKNDYQEKLRSVTETQTQLRAAEAMIEADPAGFLLSKIPPEVTLQVAKALIAEHYDTLKPELEAWYEDTGARKLFVATQKEASIAAQQQFERARTHQEAAAAVQSAVQALVPESAPEQDAQDFYADALTYLSRLAQQGERVTPATVEALLASRIKRYGFIAEPVVPASPAPPVSARTAAPAPVSTPNTSRPAAAAAPVVRTVPAAIATQRQNAAATVPPGPGAAPASLPRPPKGLNLDQALDWMGQQQKLRASV